MYEKEVILVEKYQTPGLMNGIFLCHEFILCHGYWVSWLC